jgi:hypothetical protein
MNGDASPVSDSTRLLSHQAFRELFSTLTADTYVSIAVVACYLGVPRITIERKLVSSYGQERPWRLGLAKRDTGSMAPFVKGAHLRWSFVIDELEGWLTADLVRADERRQRSKRPGRQRSRDARRAPLFELGGTIGGLLFIVDARGRVVAALGQEGVTARAVVDALDDGGWLARLSPIEALSLAWTSLQARAPWENAVREALRLHIAAVDGLLEDGLFATRALLHARTPADHRADRPFAVTALGR